MENTDNKAKSWLSRLKYLKIRRQASKVNCNNEANLQRNFSTGDNDNLSTPQTLHFQRRNSFRRTITNVQNRMMNVFRHNRNNSSVRYPSEYSIPSLNINSRVTLNTLASHKENEYTLEPAETGHLNNEESLPHIPPRLDLGSENEVGSSSSTTTPVISPRSRNFPQLYENVRNGCVPKNEVAKLSNFYWYWGPITKAQAEERLRDLPDGAFLVRDSCSERYIFTMSFRNIGKILHTRIDLSKSGYSLFDQTGYSSIAELVEDAVAKSKNSVYCYTKPRDDCQPHCPVRLTLPVSRVSGNNKLHKFGTKYQQMSALVGTVPYELDGTLYRAANMSVTLLQTFEQTI